MLLTLVLLGIAVALFIIAYNIKTIGERLIKILEKNYSNENDEN
ncbi:hypothetical protein J2Z83_003046 [Virgibacillus natechei]|uniref:Uncharacterized protein n=1 Tax=Virgibacillus natechei TaxID=1216297 RepID=A0ABS4IK14_9BACI|nr:hypothetical protein [Virgibacillus natechei]MBP1970910.1 hypothetical protein [Virgibacillus natechei]UZD13292.1 hypothetical protein OLD84_01620 [Virgibacillus natechei]